MKRAKNKRTGGQLKKWILIINLFFILLLILAYATPFIRVERWGWLTLLALAYPFLLFINGCFAAGWLMFRSGWSILSLLLLLGGMDVHTRYFKLFSSASSKGCHQPVQVLSYNLRGLSIVPVVPGATMEQKIESLYQAVSDQKEYPDILSIQEGSKGEYIATTFGLPNIIHGTKSTLWILSRYPVVQQGELKGDESNPFCIWADLKTPEGMLRVYNMHLTSNRVTNTTEELIQDMDFQNENTWNSIRFIMSRYKYTTSKRAKEAASLHGHIQKCPYPALVTGDGNDTPLSRVYHLLTEGMMDGFRKKGSGLSTTYPSTLPLLRIDYLLGTPDILFQDYRTPHIRYSDHYPVSCGICIQPGTGS